MQRRSFWPLSLGLFVVGGWLLSVNVLGPARVIQPDIVAAQDEALRQVNAPFDAPFGEAAVFWFGRVGPAENYADVRVSYDETHLFLHIAAFDRRLWYDTSPTVGDLTSWDAVTVYLDMGSSSSDGPDENAFRLDGQLVWWEARDTYQAAYQGDGSTWVPAAIDFVTKSGWRGDAPNNDLDDRGWWLQYHVPFASLGLEGPPLQGSVWGLATVLHDRDDAVGTPIADQAWPEAMDAERPATWGRLAFGLPRHIPPPARPEGTTIIRHGLDGARVVDADVGGSSVCGAAAAPDYFSTWGTLNYAGKDFLNIQNQGDVADWPCFSKYYVTFPLDHVPPDTVIISATLTLHLWGGAGEGLDPGPQPSLIQVLTVDAEWDEATISWNNAPLARENISATWVEPVLEYPGRPGIPYDWDVSRAVAEAQASGSPLRLAVYEADWAYHSGKYFDSCDVDDWGAEGRPTLTVTWGRRVAALHSAFLPQVLLAPE